MRFFDIFSSTGRSNYPYVAVPPAKSAAGAAFRESSRVRRESISHVLLCVNLEQLPRSVRVRYEKLALPNGIVAGDVFLSAVDISGRYHSSVGYNVCASCVYITHACVRVIQH